MDPKNLRSLLLTDELPKLTPDPSIGASLTGPENPPVLIPEEHPFLSQDQISSPLSAETRQMMSQFVKPDSDPMPEPELSETPILPGLTLGRPAPRPERPAFGLSSMAAPMSPHSPKASMQSMTTMEAPTPSPAPPAVPNRAMPPSHPPAAPSTFTPSFLNLKTQIVHDLEAHLSRLLTLNVSRREAVAQHLDRLAGQAPGPSSVGGNLDPAAGLRRWIEGPRSPAQNSALQAYFEELALTLLGQAVLLKAWSDRSIRQWSETDLKDLNWTMNTALKPFVPLDRESWQVARQNIYSWYKPGPTLQKEIWNTIAPWRIAPEGPNFLSMLFAAAKKAQPEHVEPQGYDLRLFQALWNGMPAFGFDPEAKLGPLKRSWSVFSPTLRDGSMVRSAPVGLSWIGLESSPFQLMLCELMQLWWGPSAPPLWAHGTGLEVHTKDQLALNLGSPKPSLISRIAEMEACDLAFVLEERLLRSNARSPEAVRFREHVDSIPYFKKLRSAGTTLGALQACVALSKLRPKGLLWWIREEPIDERDGGEVLNFLLERSKLICEWNFVDVEHDLPGASTPLLPRHVYLFCREPDVEERLSHRPKRLTVNGQIRSHVEVPNFFEDAFQPSSSGTTRGPWKTHLQESPTPQRDWATRWPTPIEQFTVQLIEKLREASLPLASSTTIRPTPDPEPNSKHGWVVHPSLRGFWIQPVAGERPGREGRRLSAHPLPKFQTRPGLPPIVVDEAHGSGFLVLVADESAIAPMIQYLESDTVSQWLEYHCERRHDRWHLTEQIVRWIPVPRPLLLRLGLSAGNGSSVSGDLPIAASFQSHQAGGAVALTEEWNRIAHQILENPETIRRFIDQAATQVMQPGFDPQKAAASIEGMTEVFVRSARLLEQLRSDHSPLFNLVDERGKVQWKQILDILPKSETTTVSLHPKVSITGNLPLHLPIAQFVPIKSPSPGILLATESGLFLKIHTESSLVLEMLWGQIHGLQSPTWSELLQYLKLPRRLELAETTVSDVLRSHREQMQRMRGLVEILCACRLY